MWLVLFSLDQLAGDQEEHYYYHEMFQQTEPVVENRFK